MTQNYTLPFQSEKWDFFRCRLQSIFGLQISAAFHSPRQKFGRYRYKPPRSDVLPKLAEVLGVKLETLLTGGEIPATALPRKGGPKGKMQEVFEKAAQLPCRQQDKIIELVAAFLLHYEHTKLTDAQK